MCVCPLHPYMLLLTPPHCTLTEAMLQGVASVVVGLTGYPNVGKSSTINALYGKKKTAVAPTPGKTKHFQTLHVRPALTLCDCPGLVLPRFAANKAEMVAAGVLPIDRLTDTRPPVDVVAQRVGRGQLEAVYGIRLPKPAMHEQQGRCVIGGRVGTSSKLGGWLRGSTHRTASRVVAR